MDDLINRKALLEELDKWINPCVNREAEFLSGIATAISEVEAAPANEPLTLDEMNALDHEPIYVLHTGGKWTMNGWHIATASSYQNHGRCDLEIDNGNTTIDTQNYGKTWLAYDHKPGGEQT